MKNKRPKTNLIIKYFIISLYGAYIFIFSQAFAQLSTITGKVTSNRWPVKEALVTFIDEVDTTQKFSTQTDNLGNYQIGVPTAIKSDENKLPDKFELAQNYPNPFSSSTAIPYRIKNPSDIKVTIYDILGKEVRNFWAGLQTAGSHTLLWDGRNSVGQKVSNGLYFYRLQIAGESHVKKMILNSGMNTLVPLQQLNFSYPSEPNYTLKKYSNGENYSIKIENTANTTPIIIPEQIENINVKNDTTINFNVNYLLSAAVNLDSVHQIIRGFGAANILLWRPDMTDSEIQTAFGTGEGELGFTILRIMLEADSDRWNLYIPTAKKAYDMGATIIAAPWYAPAEMVETVDGISRVRYDMYGEYAEHLDSFNTYMANNGVPIYGISIQNEPDITDQWTSWTPDEMFTFMRDNAHAIEGTKVMAPESFQFRRNMSDPILNDSVACANTDIICGHIYGGGLASYPLAEEKGKEVWMTEHLSGENDSANDWAWSLAVATEMNDVMKTGMSAYIWWYIVRYYGPISDGMWDDRLIKGTVTKKGYVMSQFSKFIRPGDYRVDCSVYPASNNISVSAYKDTVSSKVVIVAVNTSSVSEDVAFTFKNGTIDTFTPYTTTEFKNMDQGEDITVGDNILVITLEDSSITTFVSNF